MRMRGWAGGRILLAAGAICLIAAVSLPYPGYSVIAGHQPKAGAQAVVCEDCHACSRPTAADPCMKVSTCPRHKAMDNMQPDLGPDVVVLDDLEKHYVPVRFDHQAHAQMVRFSNGCETCHHYTPPNSAHPTCKECHPVEILHEDITQPGLKGAYHRNCMRCHTEWDSDTACEVCHEKKTAGAVVATREHTSYSPIEMKELILFKTSYSTGDQVPFHHGNHSTLYERDCAECHQQQSCTRCHVQGGELHPMGELDKVNLHDTCFKCHDGNRCKDCHGRSSDRLFQHADTGWPLRSYHAKLHCKECHGASGPIRKLDNRCSACHPGGWNAKSFDHRITGVILDEVHAEVDCETCHPGGPGAEVSCEACHDDGRSYSKAKGFGAN